MSFPDGSPIIIDLDPQGRVAMKRDMELVRDILRTIRDKDDLIARELPNGDHEEWIFKRHVEALYEAGLLDASISRPLSGLPVVKVRDLSWAGHDLAGALLDEEAWAKIKQEVEPAKLVSMPLKVLSAISQAVLEALVKKQLGLE